MQQQGGEEPDAILINGFGRNWNAPSEDTSIPLEVVQVVPGLRHRLRFVNAGTLICPYVVR